MTVASRKPSLLEVRGGALSDVGTGLHPAWSPDATSLVISLPEDGFGILQLGGLNRWTPVNSTGWAAGWSPDGDWIVFTDAGLTASSE